MGSSAVIVDKRPVHCMPEQSGMHRSTQAICGASICADSFGTWTADARNVTCYACARMLMERMARIVVDVEGGTVVKPKMYPAASEEMTQAMRDAQSSTHVDRICEEIRRERECRDKKYGGPAKDDRLTPVEWRNLIWDYASLCYDLSKSETPEEFERRMIRVAALAVTAIQSSRRKRAT